MFLVFLNSGGAALHMVWTFLTWTASICNLDDFLVNSLSYISCTTSLCRLAFFYIAVFRIGFATGELVTSIELIYTFIAKEQDTPKLDLPVEPPPAAHP